jgi:hypothetical protein
MDASLSERVGNQFRNPGHNDTPTGAGERLDLVGFEGEDTAVCGRPQPSAFRSPDDHRLVKDREGHRHDGRKRRVREDDTPDNRARQQLDGFPSGQGF